MINTFQIRPDSLLIMATQLTPLPSLPLKQDLFAKTSNDIFLHANRRTHAVCWCLGERKETTVVCVRLS